MVQIKTIDFNSADFETICQFSGDFFNVWLDTWKTLPYDQKDPYTHPVWIISYLKSRYHVETNKDNLTQVLKLFSFHANKKFLTAIPFRIERKRFLPEKMIILKSHKLLISSSLALEKKYHCEILESLFNFKIDTTHIPALICFYLIDETHDFLTANVNKVIHKDYERSYLDFRPGYEAFFNNLNSNLRRNLRHSKKKLSSIGNLTLEIVDTIPDIFQAYDEFIHLEAEGWKGETSYALKTNEFSRLFYCNIIDGFSKDRQSAVFNLRLGNELIASMLTITINDTIFALKISYKEKYSKFSPGHLLYDRIIEEYIIQNKIAFLNNISKAEWFGKIWQAKTLDVYKMFVFPDTMSGKCNKAIYSLIETIKQKYPGK